jgi:hypothetical protein
MKTPTLYLIYSGMALTAWAQKAPVFDAPEKPIKVNATRTDGPINLDGKFDEPGWAAAQVISDFFRMEPRQGGAVRFKTEVRILFDEKNLYIGVIAFDSLGAKGVRVQDFRRDFEFGENDVFYVQLDPQNTRRYCMSFQVTPLGTQRDLQVFDDGFRDADWDALWDVRTHLTNDGFQAEFVIPFKTLRYEETGAGEPPRWGITFGRLSRRDYEITSFPAIPQAFTPYRMTYAAELTGLELPPPSTNIRVQPFVLSESVRYPDKEERELINRAGIDLKWAITPERVFDFTVNTDFAQADVDRAVNNLERFNILFPERRQFFLENSGIWVGAESEGIKPFFSRRIGLSGDFNSTPVPLEAGLRYVDRNASRTFAALSALQRETADAGRAIFNVVRHQLNFGKQNNIGWMATHRFDAKSATGISPAHNITLSADVFYRPVQPWTNVVLASFSYDERSARTGWAGDFFSGYSTNTFYAGWLSRGVSQSYKPGAGFVFQNDVIFHNPGGYFVIRPEHEKLQFIRRWDPGVFISYYQNARDGEFQQASLNIFPIWVFFQDNSFLEWTINPTWQRINFQFAPVGITISQSDYYYLRQSLRYRSNQSRKIAVTGQVEWGDFYDGVLTSYIGTLRVAPVPHLALSGTFRRDSFRNLGANSICRDVDLMDFEARLAVNPRLLLSAFYQYNRLDRSSRVNARFSWQFTPLSFVYLVVNENVVRNTAFYDPLRPEQAAIAKINYMHQF